MAESARATDAATSKQVRSVCPYCGVGCGIVLHVQDNLIVKVSGDKQHPSNFGRLCTKGSTCGQAVAASGRMEHAFLRQDRQREPVRVGIDEAIAATARRLRAIIDEHGPDAFSLYVSGQMSLEAQYLANKLCKGFIRSRHIESNSRLCMASAGSGYKLSLGADGPPGSYEDFDHSELFLVIGANMADCHPILFLRLLDRVKAGARLVVVDPRRTATADKADLFLQIRPGTDLALLNGLLHLLVHNGQCDRAFIERFTEGWEVMEDFLHTYTPAYVAEVTGLSEAAIRQTAQWIGSAGNWMSCWTMGLNQSVHGTWHSNALCNLHLATGAICRRGSGPFSLTGQPNAMGGREMGYMGPGLPGQRSALVAGDRAFVEQLWQLPPGSLRAECGEGTVAMFEQMRAGAIKACWIICTNPVASVANRQTVIEALQSAELVITQDAYLDTETNRYADILLPGALWAEAPGVMINSERNLTLMQQAVNAPGDTLPDWQLIARVACAMGYAQAFSYTSAEQVFEELKQAYNPHTGYDLRGASYARLREAPLQWPCASADAAPRNPLRYLHPTAPATIVFPTDSGKAQFFARPYLPPVEMPDDAFPLVLNTGRVQHQWHTLTKTGKVPTLNKLNPGPFVEVHPSDATRLGIVERGRVEIRSRRGRAVLPAVISERVRPGNCFAPFHWNDVFGEGLAINALTSDALDPISLQPAFKFCAVALQALAGEPDVEPGQVEPLSIAALARLLEATPAMRPEQQPYMHGFLLGLLAGLASRSPGEAPGEPQWLVLWASQTGNSESLANTCVERLQAAGKPARLQAMDDCRLDDLRQAPGVLLVTSTFGDGDPPDNASGFWQSLQGASAHALADSRFSVLALGDSSYQQFCGFGRKLDERLAELGGQRLQARLDCEPDYQASADKWLDGLCGTQAPQAKKAPANRYGRNNPLHTRLLHNRVLNSAQADKETRQLVFDLQGHDFPYEAGDALGVWPINSDALVEELLACTGLDGATLVQLKAQAPLSLRDALTEHLEIARISPDMLRRVAEWNPSPQLQQLLHEDNQSALQAWLWGRQLPDLLREFPVAVDAAQLVQWLKPLQPRLYSISSSPKLTPDEVHLTVATVRYEHQGQARGGVCSTFLADRASATGVRIFLQRSAHFRPPQDPATPLIMIGPGTGIAPFRAFLQEREAQAATGKNWLFFGEQRLLNDFYYHDELHAWQRSGHLRLDTAFSRDQADKVYVQQRMLEHGEQFWQWLEQGAYVCVCGDAARMAKDVDAALRSIVQQHGRLSSGAAALYVSTLGKERRYLRDVY